MDWCVWEEEDDQVENNGDLPSCALSIGPPFFCLYWSPITLINHSFTRSKFKCLHQFFHSAAAVVNPITSGHSSTEQQSSFCRSFSAHVRNSSDKSICNMIRIGSGGFIVANPLTSHPEKFDTFRRGSQIFYTFRPFPFPHFTSLVSSLSRNL